MTERNSLAQEIGAALRDHGITAAFNASSSISVWTVTLVRS